MVKSMHAYAGNEKSETDSISLTRTVDKKNWILIACLLECSIYMNL